MNERRVAVITGGSGGIGAATARHLATQGLDVVIVGRNEGRLANVVASTSSQSAKVSSLMVDLGDHGSEHVVRNAVLQRHGHLDVLVHSAGDASSGTVEELTDDDWDAAFDVKLGGAVRLTRVMASDLRQSTAGAIVYVAGGAGLRPGRRHAAVGAVNAALLNFTKSTALLLAPEGVRVNAVAPGPVRTARWDRLVTQTAEAEDLSATTVQDSAIAGIPLGKIATADEVASVIAWLVSVDCSHTTGTIIPVDGGSSLA